MNNALMILTCEKNRNKLQMCYNVWLKQFNPKDTFIFSSKQNKFHQYNILKTTDNDDIHNHSNKFFQGIKMIPNDYDFYIFGQDDYFINKYNLDKMIQNLPTNEPYFGGNIYNYKGGPKKLPIFNLASCLTIMNNKFFNLILEYYETIKLNDAYYSKFKYDGHSLDVLWSYFANELNVKISDLSKYQVDKIQPNNIAYNFINNKIINDEIKNKVVIHLQSYYNGNKTQINHLKKFKKLLGENNK